MFITRAYNTFELDPTTNILTKKSKENKLKDEVKYLVSLPKKVSIFFPRIINHGTTQDTHFIEMENYAYKSLGNIMVEEKFDEDLWLKIVDSLNKINNEFSKHVRHVNGYNYTKSMYIDKTEKEYKKLIDGFDKFKQIINNKQIEINGTTYDNFYIIWNKIADYIKRHLLSKNKFSIIHGDMCFSNILCGKDPKNKNVIIRFIDPRGSFGKKWIYGDPLYDAAKLRHSYEGGYEYIIYDQFVINYTKDLKSFNCNFNNNNKIKIAKIFEQRDINSKLIEGLIFIGMCARHYDSIKRQIIMYLTGVKILNEVIWELDL